MSRVAALSIAAEADRPRVAHGPSFLVPPLGAPHRDELDLARLGRAVGLLARAGHQLLLAHRHTRAIHPQVQRRRHRRVDRQRLDDAPLVFGDLAPQRLGGPLDVRGGHVHPGQRGQQLVALLEADHRPHLPDHAQHTGRQLHVARPRRGRAGRTPSRTPRSGSRRATGSAAPAHSRRSCRADRRTLAPRTRTAVSVQRGRTCLR